MTINKYILALAIVGFLVFGNSLFNGFVWDDEEQVLNNSLIHSITNLPNFFLGSTFNTGGGGGLAGMYYKPMMSVGFSALYTFFGANAFFFHLFQVSLHIINSMLIFSLMAIFFSTSLSFFLALVFLVHPINVETAVYISALQDVLYMFFGLLALRKIKSGLVSFRDKVTFGLLILSSLLSKETGFLFIPLIGFYSVLFAKKNLKSGAIILTAVLSCYFFLRLIIANVPFGHHGPSPILNAALLERLQTVPQIIFFYIKTLFFPKDLAIAQHWVVRTFEWSSFGLPLILSLIFFILIFLWLGYTWFKNKQTFPIVIFFVSWFLIGLSLHLQIFPLDMTVADRWFYLPIVGFLGISGTIISYFLKKYSRFSKYLSAIGLIIVVLLSMRTITRNFDWKDGLTLYSHDVNISKDAFDLENNFGVELFRAGKLPEAEVHFRKSTQLAPYWWTNWNNLGVIVERQGNINQAKEYYQKSIENGGYYLAYENMANILFKEDPQKAREFCKASLDKLPLNPKLWILLAVSDYKLGQKEEALLAARQAYILSPTQQTYYLYTTLQQNRPLELP